MRNFGSVPDEGFFDGGAKDNVELLKAWAGTTLAYALFITGVGNLLSNIGGALQNLLIAGVVCGLGMILHELAHRFVARRFGAQAHFLANTQMLLVSIVLACLPIGLLFIAPGAVWHRGVISARQGGLIALAGPATNMVLSLLFLAIYPILFALGLDSRLLQELCFLGVSLNASLGLFNMIPAGPFDGAKVLAWDARVFGVTVVVAIALTFGVGPNIGPIWSAIISLLIGRG